MQQESVLFNPQFVLGEDDLAYHTNRQIVTIKEMKATTCRVFSASAITCLSVITTLPRLDEPQRLY